MRAEGPAGKVHATMSGEHQQAPRASRLIIGVISTLLGAIAWGFSGTCVQYLFSSTHMDALLLTTIRELGAGITFLLVLLIRDRTTLTAMLADKDTLRRLAIFGSCGLFLNSTVYALTISYTNAGTATVLQSLNIVIVLAVTCIATRRLPRRLETLALVCAFAATVLIATHGDLSQLHLPPEGLFFGLATAAAASFYTMYPKPLFARWGSFAVTVLGMLVGGLTGIMAFGTSGIAAQGMPALDGTSLAVLAVAVFVGTFAAYGLFLHGISIVGPVAGNMLGAAEPVSATVISALWLATPFVWADWAGLALMVATIALVALQRDR